METVLQAIAGWTPTQFDREQMDRQDTIVATCLLSRPTAKQLYPNVCCDA